MEKQLVKEQKIPFWMEISRGGMPQNAFRAALALLIFVGLCILAGKPLLAFVGNADRFRAWAAEAGGWSRIAFLGMMAGQIILAFIPGEPLEIAAGCAFGPVEGTALCMLGALIGGVTVFLLVRRFGMRVACLFFPVEKLLEAPLFRDEKRMQFTLFLLFFIPGTPKDLMTYCAGLTDIRFSYWLLITSVARLPSIVTSTFAGDALSLHKLPLAVGVFAATAAVSLFGLWFYRKKTR